MDYWSDKLKRSILLDSGADIVSYGMGERSIVEIADALQRPFHRGHHVHRGYGVQDPFARARLRRHRPSPFEEMLDDKLAYARSFNTQYLNSDPFTGKRMVEEYPHQVYVVQNPPSKPLSRSELDAVYRLPYMRTYHPSYESAGGVPAITEVKFSLSSNRGCFGECSFCALTFHQGRIVQSRSKESLVEEAKLFFDDPDFKGYIHDVGGPTANFRAPACQKQMKHGACPHKSCLFPKPCSKLEVDHEDYLDVLRTLRSMPEVKKVFVRSGVRLTTRLPTPTTRLFASRASTT
ncbi:MAG: hypothetical protein ACLTQI_02720 [Slackia sp.]